MSQNHTEVDTVNKKPSKESIPKSQLDMHINKLKEVNKDLA